MVISLFEKELNYNNLYLVKTPQIKNLQIHLILEVFWV